MTVPTIIKISKIINDKKDDIYNKILVDICLTGKMVLPTEFFIPMIKV